MSPNATPGTHTALQIWQRHWSSLSPRERTLLRSAFLCCGLALTWWLAIAPARHTVVEAEQHQAQLEAQRQAMLTWRAQALALQGRPPIERQTSLSVLQTSLKNQLGNKADLQIQNDRANLTLKGVEPQALLSWLEQARLNAHVLPNDAKLKRNAAGQWEGRLTLVLPGA